MDGKKDKEGTKKEMVNSEVNFFDPGFKLTAECEELINKARKKIASMDKIDGGADIMLELPPSNRIPFGKSM